MTQQVLRERQKVDVSGCRLCQHRYVSQLFELCVHATSAYTVDGVKDHHTVQHMREEYGPCGKDMRLRLAVE